jgi:hypothetical protein
MTSSSSAARIGMPDPATTDLQQERGEEVLPNHDDGR